MAKAITEKLLKDKKLNHPVEVVAAGLAPTRKTEASYAARFVIKEMFDEDLLRDHKPTQLTPEIIHSADLILLMDRSLLVSGSKSLPPEKTFILKEFFGGAGDIKDPYPDGRDDRTIGRYRKCAQELRQVLSQNLDALVSKLEV